MIHAAVSGDSLKLLFEKLTREVIHGFTSKMLQHHHQILYTYWYNCTTRTYYVNCQYLQCLHQGRRGLSVNYITIGHYNTVKSGGC